MAKYKYVLVGPEAGATGHPVIKELATFEGDAFHVDDGFVRIIDYTAQNLNVAVIRLAEGQSIKRVE